MRTHYDVLNLDKTCTAKEIKESFIRLSKKFHPDLNKSRDAHKKFVEVNEAYSVLGNINSRHRYDATLPFARPITRPTHSAYTSYRPAYENCTVHYTWQRKRGDVGGPYITTSKVKLFVFCCLVMVFGSSLQVIAESRRRNLRNQEIALALKEARERTCKIGREQRIRELREVLLKR